MLGCSTRTFEVAGHHYALVRVTGLEPDTTYPYEVTVDGEVVWPPPRLARSRRARSAPAARRRPGGTGSSSGRAATPRSSDPKLAARLGIDALDAFAARDRPAPREEWPDALLLLGDQVYADELTPQNRRRIAGRRDRHPEWPDDEIVGFDEYVGLYRDSWSDPEVRWLLSCVPTGMIFDDHDVRDDWNTSAVWREEMAQKPWWRERIRSALASYWVYQHLGNLPAEELAADPDYRKIMAARGRHLAAAGRARRPGRRRGRRRQGRALQLPLGPRPQPVRDDRLAERPDPGRRRAPHARRGGVRLDRGAGARPASGRVDHLVLGTSLPWLLPHAIGDLQSGQRDRGGPARLARPAGRDDPPGRRPGALAGVPLVVRPADPDDRRGRDGPDAPGDHQRALRRRPPQLRGAGRPAGSGDDPGQGAGAVHQLTCSPVHNDVDWFIQPGFRLGWSRTIARATPVVGRPGRGAAARGELARLTGPLFGNTIATLDIDGKHAQVTFLQPRSAGSMTEVAKLVLADGPRAATTSGRAALRARM